MEKGLNEESFLEQNPKDREKYELEQNGAENKTFGI